MERMSSLRSTKEFIVNILKLTTELKFCANA